MRPPALGYRLRVGICAYGTSNVTNVKLLNQDSKLSARHSESQRDRWQDEYVHSLRIGTDYDSGGFRLRPTPGSRSWFRGSAVRVEVGAG